MKIVRPFFSQPCLLLACALTFMASSAQAGILNATLIEDTYVQSGAQSGTSYSSEGDIYIRNYIGFGRMGLVQFALPQLTDGLTVDDITAAELAGVISFEHDTARSITLEFLALSVNQNLSGITYSDLLNNGVVTGYSNHSFTYGTQEESLGTLSFDTANTAVGDTQIFNSAELLSFIKDNISDTGEVTITFAIGPVRNMSATDVNIDVDHKFYTKDSTVNGAVPVSLILTTAPAEVPEPGTMTLLAVLLGVGVIVARRRR